MAVGNLGRRLSGWRFATMLLLIAGCFLLGGASRLDVMGLIVLQPLAILCAGIFLIVPGEVRWDSIRPALIGIAALALVMVVQLIPLPPSLWMAFPGHAALAQTAEVPGIAQPWRPISVTPDLTLASLVSLSVPLAFLIGFAALTNEQTHRLLPYLIAGAALSALLGLAQIAGGGRGPLYFYSVTNLGSPVGLFANRNHQAVVLAMALPMLALWARRGDPGPLQPARPMLALAIGLFFLPLILVNGSRAGLVLGVIGLAGALIFWRQERRPIATRKRFSGLVAAGVTGLVVAIIGTVLWFSRDEALRRLTETSVADETRLTFFPTIAEMALDFAPLGSGFGSFDRLFRSYETLELLNPEYLNHAHNDLLELALTGGLPALMIVAGFLVWLVIAGMTVVRRMLGRRREKGASASCFAQLGLTMILILLLSSLVDYPLRTPLLSALFALACGFVGSYRSEQAAPRRVRGETALPAEA